MTQIRAGQLDSLLQGALAPVCFIHGDETLLVNESADAVRCAARKQGYTDREVFNVDRSFDWTSLQAASDSLSLFAERRVLELRIPGGKPGKEGAKVLCEYAGRPPEDTLLLIISGKLEAAARRSKWVQALDKVGVSLTIWPVEVKQLPGWISQRMQARDMRASPQALQILADRVEGNLLAAAQEIEKLYLLHGPGELSEETVTGLVSDSARYDVFGLVDAALQADIRHVQRILAGLRAEGLDPTLVLWALSREIRSLAAMAREVANGTPVAAVLASRHVWEKRKPVIGGALQRIRGRQWWVLLQRCARIDLVVKGRAAGSAWDELLQLALRLAGVAPMRVSG